MEGMKRVEGTAARRFARAECPRRRRRLAWTSATPDTRRSLRIVAVACRATLASTQGDAPRLSARLYGRLVATSMVSMVSMASMTSMLKALSRGAVSLAGVF
jgi:hypothetical protein